MLIIKVVKVISSNPAFSSIRFVPANWPALVRFVSEIKMAVHAEIPPLTAINPNVRDTGM